MMVALVAVAAFALQTSFRALNDATATATAEDWNITAGAYSLLGNAEQSLAGQTAQVNIDGNNVTLSVTVSSISKLNNGLDTVLDSTLDALLSNYCTVEVEYVVVNIVV